ncbi:polysaccharide biosynthesis tyrosine autokinase [Rhodococcus sp. ARC_M6]|uniref:polysaccharide biosynthesis tyrosine autokinase n=1 Tax=Rhodococcus sp. ARC_M6 TaxID=2928852 RepID=UPI001FB45368|nr:polysaccharide biosynthesis tyrosine autokinase [Rhodococcus sp. ARC_M6]MCJ0904097.1 Wzz/FepE/Etk N-terminal domain-containing protein [Rhodococcus sp. ARC_M6]
MTNSYLKLKRWMLRGWVVAVCALFGLLIAGVMSAITPQTYSATTTLFIGSPASADSAGALQGDSFSQQRASTYAYLFKSEAIAVKVKDDLGLAVSPHELVSAVTATPIDKTVLLDVTVAAESAQGAADIANAYASNFAKYVGQLEKPNGGGAASMLVSVVGNADPTEAVTSVKPVSNVIIGLFAGVAVGGLLWWLMRRFDKSIRTADVLAEAAQAPVVGVLPAVAARRIEALDFGVESDSAYAEASRKLRTNIEFMDVDNPPRTLVVASPSPEEGAGEVAASLALALGEAGRGVILVDADLRAAALAGYLRVNNGLGLSDILGGAFEVSQVEVELQDRRITFIAAGSRREGAVDDLASSAMTDLLADLSRRYEYVVLVAPSVLNFADAASLAARVDGALIVSRREIGTTTTVARAAGVLRSAGSRIVGSVLVGARLPRTAAIGHGSDAATIVEATVAQDHSTELSKKSPSQNVDDESGMAPAAAQSAHWPPADERAEQPIVAPVVDERADISPTHNDSSKSGRSMAAAEDLDDWAPAEPVKRYTRSDIDPPTVAIRRDQLADARRKSESDSKGPAQSVQSAVTRAKKASRSDATTDSAMASDE